jgi:septum formation protein
MKNIILASSSIYRKMLLERLQIPYKVVSPDVDESNPGVPLSELAPLLAQLKAATVSKMYPNAICIGADQVPVCEGKPLSKPGTIEQNIVQLQQLSGKTVTFYAGLCVFYPPKSICLMSTTPTIVRFYPISRQQAEEYVAREPSLDCAGGFKSEGLGITLIESIESTDPTALIGLPLIQLVRDLRGIENI